MLTQGQKDRTGFKYIIGQTEPASPYGRDALRRLKPYAPHQKTELAHELQNISKTLETLPSHKQTYLRLEHAMSQTKDIRASLGRIGGQLSEVDLFEIKRFLLQLEQIAELFKKINKDARFHQITIETIEPALKLLDPDGSKIATFHISSKSFPELSEIRREKKEVERKIREAAAGEDKKETEYQPHPPTPGKAQTKLAEERSKLAAKEQKAEQKAINWLSNKLQPYSGALLENTQALGSLDLIIQKAKLAASGETCMPETCSEAISFTSMTNPGINSILAETGGTFTPLTITLEKGTTVITGANMGGKSVALKTLALNILLIHYGFYPFAKKASCPLLENINLISDDLESTGRGLSSFGGEIVKLQEVLNEIKASKTLILLDEFARGTNPTEGGAIARAVCSYLNTQEAYTVMTTHFENVAPLANTHYQVAGLQKLKYTEALACELQNAPMDERVSKIATYMDYGLHQVSAKKQLPADAINICRLLGLEEKIMKLIKT